MLDRQTIREFLDGQFKDVEIDIPKDIHEGVLVEAFCRYVEDDYYEWLEDSFKSFFNHSDPDWNWVKNRIEHYLRA